MKKQKLKNWLKFKRLEVGLDQKELANLVGCSHHTINNIERGFNTYFRSIQEFHSYRPGVKLMEAIAAQFEKSMDDVYEETDYQDLTTKKMGFGQKLPGQKRGKRIKKDQPFLEMQDKESEAVKITMHKDNSLPPIKFYVIKKEPGNHNIILKMCDNIEYAKGYIDRAYEALGCYRDGQMVKIVLLRGFLEEVGIEKK